LAFSRLGHNPPTWVKDGTPYEFSSVQKTGSFIMGVFVFLKVNLNNFENGYQDWTHGSRANLGLEFITKDNASVAISFGVSDYAGHN
jgi:hypothetical protein